jgi:hypothetical protein
MADKKGTFLTCRQVKAHEMYLDSTFYAVPDDFHEVRAREMHARDRGDRIEIGSRSK